MHKGSIAILFFITIIICQADTGSDWYEWYVSEGTKPQDPVPDRLSKVSGYGIPDGIIAKSENTPAIISPKKGFFNTIISEPVSCSGGTDPLGVCAMHAQNYNGSGISVAIIDYQFYINRLSERELPIDRIVLFNGTFDEDECHGTACAEIIGDIAPNVTLYMVGLEELSQAGFIEAAEKLNRLDERIDIVSSSIDFSFGLFDEGDDICRAVGNLTRNGTIWITAAGDSANKHWLGPFQDENENGFHEFGSDNESLNLTAERGDLIGVWLSWNDSWDWADQDFDLYLYSPIGTSAISRNPQEGYDGQKPAELVTMLAPVNGDYRIQIRRYSASEENISFQLFSTHNLSNYIVSACSVGALASCSECITVGAVDAQTLLLENYSSMGPTQDGRMKPELVAPDNITVSSYMPEMFGGSSASAPYAAGIFALALEKGRRMGMSDDEVVALLLDSAIDLGPAGPENEYGYGLVNLKRFAEL